MKTPALLIGSLLCFAFSLSAQHDPFASNTAPWQLAYQQANPYQLEILYGDVPGLLELKANADFELPQSLLDQGERLTVAISKEDSGHLNYADRIILDYAVSPSGEGKFDLKLRYKRSPDALQIYEINTEVTINAGKWIALGGQTRDEVKTLTNGEETRQKLSRLFVFRILERGKEISSNTTTVGQPFVFQDPTVITPATETSSDIILEANGTVYVVIQEQATEKIRFRGSLKEGDREVVERNGKVNLLFTAGENLAITTNGKTMRPDSVGTAKITLP